MAQFLKSVRFCSLINKTRNIKKTLEHGFCVPTAQQTSMILLGAEPSIAPLAQDYRVYHDFTPHVLPGELDNLVVVYVIESARELRDNCAKNI